MDFAHFLFSYTPLNTIVFGCCIAVVPNNVALGEEIKRTLDESVTVKGDSNATVAIFNNAVVFLHVGLLN